MRKTLCLVLILSVMGGIALFSTGCGSDGGILGVALGIIAIAAIASSGGAGLATFAASHRDSPRAAITTTGYKAVIKVNGVLATETTTLTKSDDKTQLFINAELSANPGANEYSVEIFPATANSTTDPLLKLYKVANVENGGRAAEAPTLNATSTANALAYEAWKKLNPTTTALLTINDFKPASADIDALATKIQNQLNASMTGTVTPDATFQWDFSIDAQASSTAASTTVPTTTTTTTSTSTATITTGQATLPRGKQWFPNTGVSQDALQTITSPVGLAFFQHPIATVDVLGNYWHVSTPTTPGDQTMVIAYASGTTSLDGVTTAENVTFYGTTYGAGSCCLAANQVYVFNVGGYYGALQITSYSSTEVSFSYKYNTTSGQKTLSQASFAASHR